MIPGNMVKVYTVTHKVRMASILNDAHMQWTRVGLIIKGDGSPKYGDYRQVLLSNGDKVMVSVHRLELIQ